MLVVLSTSVNVGILDHLKHHVRHATLLTVHYKKGEKKETRVLKWVQKASNKRKKTEQLLLLTASGVKPNEQTTNMTKTNSNLDWG